MKWFDIKAIVKEISKIRWPKKEDLTKNSLSVLLFIILASAFFYLCTIVISALLRVLGVL